MVFEGTIKAGDFLHLNGEPEGELLKKLASGLRRFD